MTTDKLLPDEEQLGNGIRCFHKHVDCEYTVVHLLVPVGSAHNTGQIRGGTFHFLEHMCLQASKLNPAHNSISKRNGLLGGDTNASTSYLGTVYKLTIPTIHLEDALPSFFSMVFEPCLEEENIRPQRTIIKNERNRKSRWHPGSNERGYYLDMNWMHDRPLPIEQILGSDEDLDAMSTSDLAQAHCHYFDENMVLLSCGSGDTKLLRRMLSELNVRKHELPVSYEPIHWVNQEYHEVAFRDENNFKLSVGGFTSPATDNATTRLIMFIDEYLVNQVHGTLFEHYRNLLGWVYGVSGWTNRSPFSFNWGLTVPLNNMDQVQYVRENLLDQIRTALLDNDSLAREARRILSNDMLRLETAQSIMKDMFSSFAQYRRVIPLSEWQTIIREQTNSERLLGIFDTYYAPESLGWICTTPLK